MASSTEQAANVGRLIIRSMQPADAETIHVIHGIAAGVPPGADGGLAKWGRPLRGCATLAISGKFKPVDFGQIRTAGDNLRRNRLNIDTGAVFTAAPA
jgi:hypothetical protein